MEPDQLRSYLLGRLSPAEHEAIEARAFEDDTFDSQLQEAETDLLDDWARGQLAPDDAERVMQRFPKAKREFAAHLDRVRLRHIYLDQKPAKRAAPRKFRMSWWLAAAAILLCVVSAVYFWPRRRPVSGRPSLNTSSVPAAAQVEVVALLVPSTRGGAIPVFSITGSAAIIRFTAPMIPGYRQYEMRIESAQRGHVKGQPATATGSVLSAEFDAKLIPDGDYDALIFGKTKDVPELLATYSFRIQRKL